MLWRQLGIWYMSLEIRGEIRARDRYSSRQHTNGTENPGAGGAWNSHFQKREGSWKYKDRCLSISSRRRRSCPSGRGSKVTVETGELWEDTGCEERRESEMGSKLWTLWAATAPLGSAVPCQRWEERRGGMVARHGQVWLQSGHFDFEGIVAWMSK